MSLSNLEKLKCWMEEALLDRRMGREDAAAPGGGDSPDVAGEAPPADGQIRLWPAVEEGTQPLYGLILADGYDRWRVLPFSPYAFPAIPQELRVFQDPPVRVVQGWNAREIATRLAAASWVVADLPGEARFVFERWWLLVQADEVIPDGFGDETGPPLRHPLDPRVAYLDGERVRVDLHLGEASGVYRVEPEARAAEKPEGNGEGYGSRDLSPPKS